MTPNDGDEEAARYAKDHLSSIPPSDPIAILRDWLRPSERVLDVGCGSGELGAFLAERGVEVHGIEANEARYRRAQQRLPVVEHGMAGGTYQPMLLDDSYDRILLVDVLEHVSDPTDLVRWCTGHLRLGGHIDALIPNSAHLSFRLKMARGDWSYTDAGLFDRDHLRFYDTRSFECAATGLPLTEVRRAYGFGAPRWWVLPRAWSERRWPNLLAHHTLVEWQRHPD